MTIPYNASPRTNLQHLIDTLPLDRYDYMDGRKVNIYGVKPAFVTYKDLHLIVDMIRTIIITEYDKIRKLSKYLIAVAKVCTKIGLPISWDLPSGLKISQSYLKKDTIVISPFKYSKVRLNLTTYLNTFDPNKQLISLMPNLIHSLDATSLSLVYHRFRKQYGMSCQFFGIHDCFGTTVDKIDTLKTMLASIYTEIYTERAYLESFDKKFLDTMRQHNIEVKNGIVHFDDGTSQILHPID